MSIKDVVNYVQGMVPLLIVSGIEINTHYLIAFPLILHAMSFLWPKISTWLSRRRKSITYTQNAHFEYFEGNEIYRNISWFLSINLKDMNVTGLRCDYCPLTCDVDGETRKFDPIYEIGEDHRVEYVFRNRKLYITYYMIREEKTRVKKIRIECDDIQTIIDFGEYCHREKNKYFEAKGKKTYQYYIWNSEEKEWKMFPICTIKRFENTFFNDNIGEELKDDIDLFLESKDFYREKGIPYKRGYIFYGKPGCGKSSAIYAIAHHYQRNIYFISLDQFESAKEFKAAALKIERGSVVVFEDIDSHKITHSRSPKQKETHENNKNKDNCSNHLDKFDEAQEITKIRNLSKAKLVDNIFNLGTDTSMFSTLLEVLDGYNFFSNCIVILTSNHLDKLDDAIIRAGRFDMQFEFKFPNTNTIRKVFKYFFQNEDNHRNIDIILDAYEENGMIGEVKNTISSAELINSIIMPNRRNIEKALRTFLDKVKTN